MAACGERGALQAAGGMADVGDGVVASKPVVAASWPIMWRWR